MGYKKMFDSVFSMGKIYTLKDFEYIMHRLIDLPDMLASSHKSEWKHGKKVWENILKPALIDIVRQSDDSKYNDKPDLWMLDELDKTCEKYNYYDSSGISKYIYCVGVGEYNGAKEIASSFYKDLRRYNEERRDFNSIRKLFIHKSCLTFSMDSATSAPSFVNVSNFNLPVFSKLINPAFCIS